MSQMNIHLGSSLFVDLQYAAIYPKKRHYFIFRALYKYLSIMEVPGIAFIRYVPGNESAYELTYCGSEQVQMEKWLKERIVPSIDETITNINKAPSLLSHVKTQFI